MRSIVTILSFILLCIQLSAQEKIEALKLISDICEKNISIDDFKKQYSDYFIINHDTDSTDSGLFILQNLSFAGYESNGVVFIGPYAQKSKHDCHYLFLNNCLNLFLKIIFFVILGNRMNGL